MNNPQNVRRCRDCLHTIITKNGCKYYVSCRMEHWTQPYSLQSIQDDSSIKLQVTANHCNDYDDDSGS